MTLQLRTVERFINATLWVVVAIVSLVPAAAQSDPLKLGVAVFPPNVMQAGSADDFEGFDIDLWAAIASQADLSYEMRELPFAELLEAVADGSVDVGMAAITINEQREERLDFSHAYMQSGLRILVKNDSDSNPLRILAVVMGSTSVRWLLYLIAFVIVGSHILYFAERGTGAIERAYFPGVFEAAWCVLATLTTVGYGDIAPKGWAGRAVCFMVMISGIGLFGIVIAELSSGMTLERLSSDIDSPSALNGRLVATVAGSTSVEVVRGYGARVLEVERIDDAYSALETGRAEAVVFDSPTLLYFVNSRPDNEMSLVGGLFHREAYAIAMPDGSPLREAINVALLQVIETGEYDRIYEKWFGDQP